MDARAHAMPLGPWPALAAIAAVLAVASMAAAAWGLAGTVAGWNTAFTAAAACALFGMLAARRGSPEHRYRWSCWAAATSCWLAGQVAWDVYTVARFPASPNLADLCWYGFAIF